MAADRAASRSHVRTIAHDGSLRLFCDTLSLLIQEKNESCPVRIRSRHTLPAKAPGRPSRPTSWNQSMRPRRVRVMTLSGQMM
jgi:hypothetical protein